MRSDEKTGRHGGRMTRIAAAGLAVAAVLGLAGAAQARPAGSGDDGRPNILVVMTDDMAATDVE